MTAVAVFDLLTSDSILNGFGINEDTVSEITDIDTRPVHDGYFAVLKWQESTLYSQAYAGLRNGIDRAPRVLEIWVHVPLTITRRYNTIDKILDRIDELLTAIEHLPGDDDDTITMIRKAGRSGNLTDEGWQTATRNAVYGVLYRRSAA